MNIDKLAARMAKLPKPEMYRNMSDSEYADGLAIIVADLELLARKDGCIAAAFALSFFESATSFPLVKSEDVKFGEWYWVRTCGQWHMVHGYDHGAWWRDFESIRGPIPRPE